MHVCIGTYVPWNIIVLECFGGGLRILIGWIVKLFMHAFWEHTYVFANNNVLVASCDEES